ncbi:MAG: ABC transporter permease [Treponema sp.]|jgi:putative spermidine/putrescine transport system permease protein|nr:ABC transporter permease [Treponema sp.]
MKNSGIGKILLRIMVIVIFVLVLLPVVLIFWISFFSTSFIAFPPPGYSLKWYTALLSQSGFVDAAVLSTEVALISMVFSVIIGLMASLSLVNIRRGREALQTIFLSPMTVPSIVTGIAIYVAFTQLERVLHLDLVPSLSLMALGHILTSIPTSIRLITSGLVAVNRNLEEAALNLGATRFKAFTRVVFPQIRPTLMAAAIFAFIFSLGNLEISLMLVSPGHNMLPIETLNYVLWNMDPTIAALSSVQIVFIMILLFTVDRLIGLSVVF